VAVYKAKVVELPQLADLMQEKFHRSPGYFAYRTPEAARMALAAFPGKAASVEYTMDQGARVRPMVAAIAEAELSRVINQLAAYKNRYYSSDTGAASSRWTADLWKSLAGGRSDVSVELFPHQGWGQASVILTVRGSAEPDQVVVLGGHIDSIAGWGGASNAAPGADDNASGVAVLTEAIRVLVKAGYQPARTLKFVAYSAEEVGLRGSQDVAEALQGAGAQVLGVANFDMAAYKGSAEDILLISDYTDAEHNAFLGRLIDEYTGLRWGTTACGYGCSDHASWNALGVPASFPFETKNDEDNPNIHTARDTLAQIGGKADHAAGFAKLAVAYLAEMGK
jgi:leucyl aminopeptidase